MFDDRACSQHHPSLRPINRQQGQAMFELLGSCVHGYLIRFSTFSVEPRLCSAIRIQLAQPRDATRTSTHAMPLLHPLILFAASGRTVQRGNDYRSQDWTRFCRESSSIWTV